MKHIIKYFVYLMVIATSLFLGSCASISKEEAARRKQSRDAQRGLLDKEDVDQQRKLEEIDARTSK